MVGVLISPITYTLASVYVLMLTPLYGKEISDCFHTISNIAHWLQDTLAQRPRIPRTRLDQRPSTVDFLSNLQSQRISWCAIYVLL